MRTLLFEAANVLITSVRRFSPLKAWAVRLAALPTPERTLSPVRHKNREPWNRGTQA